VAETHQRGLQHHFHDMEQQREAGTLGIWVFLITEIMFFGGLFLAYILYRSIFPHEFALASHELDIGLGGFNTVVLIASSLTMAMAVHASQLGRQRALVGFLVATMVLGTTFLGVKAVEYKAKFTHHLFPGLAFHYEPHEGAVAVPESAGAALDTVLGDEQVVVRPGGVEMFFFLYFAMTGVHALHMVVGVGILAVLLVMALRGRFDTAYHQPVHVSGLYWHFVDIVWIFLFPLLYLLGRHV